MKRWLVTLTDPQSEVGLCEVLAPSKSDAVTLVEDGLGPLNAKGARRAIVAYRGEDAACTAAHVSAFTRRNGVRTEIPA